MSDSAAGLVALLAAGAALWMALDRIAARARERRARAFEEAERAIRADERRRADERFARLLLDASPAPRPPAPEAPAPAEDCPNLDDKLPWEARPHYRKR